MQILILLILVCLAVLFYIFISKGENKSRPTSHPRRRTKPQKRLKGVSLQKEPSIFSENLPHPLILDEAGVLVPEADRLDQSHEIRDRIKNGIDLILSAEPQVGSDRGPTRLAGEIVPTTKREVLQEISRLSDFRATYQLYKTLDNPQKDMSDLARFIVMDPLLAGKVLKVANSAYFGMMQRVNSIGHALMIIGLANLKNILYQEGILKALNIKVPRTQTVESLLEHSILTSICASYIHPLFDGLDKGALFTMGLLHDVGKFVMIGMKPVYETGDDGTIISQFDISLDEEEQLFGINHAAIGQLIFQEWGFSDLMVRMAEAHHAPSSIEKDSLALDQEQLQYLLALFLADQVAKLFTNTEERKVFPLYRLDPSFYPLFDRKKLSSLILDSSLFSEIRKAKALMQSYD